MEKQTENKKQNIFAKIFKDKNSLKFFLIAFFAFVLVFGATATGIILLSNNANNGKTSSTNVSVAASTTYSPVSEDAFNVMILGFNDFSGSVKSIQLMRVDPAKGQLPIVSFPTFTFTQTDNKIRSLSECYNEGGRDLLKRALEEITNTTIDYYVSIDLNGFKSTLSKLGNITFTLNRDISYTDNTDPQKPIVYNLKKGKNTLDAEKGVAVMRFPQYVGGDVERGNLHAQFIKALITQKLNSNLFADAQSLYNKYAGFVQTDFSVPNLVTHLNAIKYVIALGGDQIQYLELSGGTKIIGSKSYYEIENTEVADLFTSYFGAK